jgi:hypothetical protein
MCTFHGAFSLNYQSSENNRMTFHMSTTMHVSMPITHDAHPITMYDASIAHTQLISFQI